MLANYEVNMPWLISCYTRGVKPVHIPAAQIEPAPTFGSNGQPGGHRARTVHTSTGPGWTSTTITFGDSGQPGVLTLHNLLGEHLPTRS